MSSFDYFKEFYQSLDGLGMFTLWILIFLFVFLTVISVCLFLKNKELSHLLDKKIAKEKDLERQLNIKVELKSDSGLISGLNKDNIVSVTSRGFEDKETESHLKETKIIKEYDLPDKHTYVDKKENLKYNSKDGNKKSELYHNNSYQENSKRFQTSPVNIDRKDTVLIRENPVREKSIKIEKELSSDTTRLSGILNGGLANKSSKGNKDFESSSNISFVEELSRKMEQEVKPKTIELTDYEKKQEDEAIISYDELMQNKDRLYNITDDEDDEGFIEELKYFRQSLQ